MERSRKYSISYYLAVLLMALLLMTGCASRGNSISYLDADELAAGDGYSSIVVLRLQVIDRTSANRTDVKRGHFAGYDEIRVGGISKQGISLWDDWHEQEGYAYYEDVLWAQAKPGDHEFRSIEFRSIRYGSTFSVSLVNTLNIEGLSVPPGRIVYLGDFIVEMTGSETVSKGWGRSEIYYSYAVRRNQTPDGLASALGVFGRKFPKLFGRFKERVETVQKWYLFVEDFQYDRITKYHNDRGWSEKSTAGLHAYFDGAVFDNNYNSTAFVMESMDDHFHRQSTMPQFRLPLNFAVELDTQWLSGVDSFPYGLILWSDKKSGYCFSLSGSGWATVDLFGGRTIQQPQLIPWQSNAATRGDGVALNRQRIEKRGDTLSYFVNDKLVGQFTNVLDFTGSEWALGIEVGNKQKVAFQRMRVWELQ